MKFILVYYSPYDSDKVFEEENVALHQYKGQRIPIADDKIASYSANNKPAGGASLFLRSLEAYHGEVERHHETLPLQVVIIAEGAGSDDAIERVREAYEAVDVKVTSGSFDDEGEFGNLATAGKGSDEDRFDGDMDKLKERATDLSIVFAPNIGYKSLLARVSAKEAEDEESRRNHQGG